MDNAHHITLTLQAPPRTVYEAIASPTGIRRWWTRDIQGGDRAGDVMRVTFREDHWTEFRIDELVIEKTVSWACVAQNEPSFDRIDEWVGTRVTFDLDAANEDGTILRFAHHGLVELECHDLCRRGWDFYVGASLRALVETGQGTPDTPRSDR